MRDDDVAGNICRSLPTYTPLPSPTAASPFCAGAPVHYE